MLHRVVQGQAPLGGQVEDGRGHEGLGDAGGPEVRAVRHGPTGADDGLPDPGFRDVPPVAHTDVHADGPGGVQDGGGLVP